METSFYSETFNRSASYLIAVSFATPALIPAMAMLQIEDTAGPLDGM
jgi:hypothetical protein